MAEISFQTRYRRNAGPDAGPEGWKPLGPITKNLVKPPASNRQARIRHHGSPKSSCGEARRPKGSGGREGPPAQILPARRTRPQDDRPARAGKLSSFVQTAL